mmetsp:Transcript_22192/g.44066  ORF Transcript_22192/g.44066 Transcript_22192/m.44066 type:complete len:303 (+) Transcript_22192:38-946(+)
MSSPCCPDLSVGSVPEPKDQKLEGTYLDLDSLSCYVVGKGNSAILVGHDVFGIESGRTRLIADDLARSLGVLVVVPDFWGNKAAGGEKAGQAISDFASPAPEKKFSWWSLPKRILSAAWSLPSFVMHIRANKWPGVHQHICKRLVPFLQKRGVVKLGLLGYCWGGWFITHASTIQYTSSPGGEEKEGEEAIELCCAVGFHPSFPDVAKLCGDDVNEVLSRVRVPQMLLAASNDKAAVKPGGCMQEAWAGKSFGPDCVFECFNDQQHGWVNRGDVSEPHVAAAASKAIEMAKEFFSKHMGIGE